MRKPAIPDVSTNIPPDIRGVLLALKLNVEGLEGRRGRIAELDSLATLDETIAKVNEILERLQG